MVLTSPVQIPLMAGRDAASWNEDPAVSAGFFPITVPLYAVEHVAFTTVYLLDLTVAPIHLFDEREPITIYEPRAFPMTLTESSREMLEGSLFSVVVVVGTVAISILLTSANS